MTRFMDSEMYTPSFHVDGRVNLYDVLGDPALMPEDEKPEGEAADDAVTQPIPRVKDEAVTETEPFADVPEYVDPKILGENVVRFNGLRITGMDEYVFAGDNETTQPMSTITDDESLETADGKETTESDLYLDVIKNTAKANVHIAKMFMSEYAAGEQTATAVQLALIDSSQAEPVAVKDLPGELDIHSALMIEVMAEDLRTSTAGEPYRRPTQRAVHPDGNLTVVESSVLPLSDAWHLCDYEKSEWILVGSEYHLQQTTASLFLQHGPAELDHSAYDYSANDTK